MRWLHKVVATILSVLATGFFAMAGVSQTEAVSNLKSWVEYFGIEGIGDGWTHATDVAVMLIAGSVLVALSAWFIWDYRSSRSGRIVRRSPVTTYSVPSAPVPTTWIPRDEAAGLVRRSSLVRMRVPAGTITVLEALLRQTGVPTTKTPEEIRAGELTRKLLRYFEAQHPSGVRDGQYGKELLEWWIDEQADRMAP